jgi:hypothetical protein
MTSDLTDEEERVLVRLLKRSIEDDRYPLSPRVRVMRGILDKLGAPPIAAKPLLAPKRYAPPRAKRRRVLTAR